MHYCKTFFNYNRRLSEVATIGKLHLGGHYPIRVQSMANTDTNNLEESVSQAERIMCAGGELVRFTTQGVREAKSLAQIAQTLRAKGLQVPLVADVHFNPAVAEEAAAHIEKVRINPGNFVAGHDGDYSDLEYLQEIEKIRARLQPLIQICKTNGTALRIGVNHGSLAPRIVNRYGDTPAGLAASCLEFVRLCHESNFHNIVLSIKASNTLVMVQAVRLLVAQMNEQGLQCPLHLGVTEAGNGEEGRIKSAVGIGTLLADGIGDTIRVSLSEEPEMEIPVGRQLVDYISLRQNHVPIEAIAAPHFNPFNYHRRNSHTVKQIGGMQPPVVITTSNEELFPTPDIYWDSENDNRNYQFCTLSYSKLNAAVLEELEANPNYVILLQSEHVNPVGEMRAFFHTLLRHNITNAVILCRTYNENNLEALQLKAAADLGALLLDGFGDGILITNNNTKISAQDINSTAFAILQASRVRMSRTEYIACPSCGRTLFDLQSTLNRVKAETSHLKNLKIAVMGCIVNGPGEMADADYGYVGAGKGKVSLYRGMECIEKNIPEELAVSKLLELIHTDGRDS